MGLFYPGDLYQLNPALPDRALVLVLHSPRNIDQINGAKRHQTPPWAFYLQLVVWFQVKDVCKWNKPILVATPLILTELCGAADAVLTALGRRQPITSVGGGRRAGGASVTASGPWSSGSHSSSGRPAASRTGSWSSDWAVQTKKYLHVKAHYHFHLTVIHEILQAYLQVLRRLLLNLLCQGLNWPRRFLWKISISWLSWGFPPCDNHKNCDFFLISRRRNNKLGKPKRQLEHAELVTEAIRPRVSLFSRARRVPCYSQAYLYNFSSSWLKPTASLLFALPFFFYIEKNKKNIFVPLPNNMSPELEENSQGEYAEWPLLPDYCDYLQPRS